MEQGKSFIMADLPGPKMRVGKIEPEPIQLRPGESFTLTSEEVAGNQHRVSMSFARLPKVVKPGEGVRPVVRATIEGKDEMVGWAWQRPDGGRSFGFSGLHFHDNWKRAEYRRLLAQGVAWTLKLPCNELRKAAEAGQPVEPTDRIYFEDWAALCAVLTPKRYELLRHLRRTPASGVRPLARALAKSFSVSATRASSTSA